LDLSLLDTNSESRAVARIALVATRDFESMRSARRGQAPKDDWIDRLSRIRLA
jgi:hypothetical protein